MVQEAIAAGNSEEAEEYLEQAIAAQPDKATYALRLALCICNERGDPARALPWLDEALRLADAGPAAGCVGGDATATGIKLAAFEARARVNAALGHAAAADADLSAAAALPGAQPRLWELRGNCMASLGRNMDAIQCALQPLSLPFDLSTHREVLFSMPMHCSDSNCSLSVVR
jgi:tetratricopeptide (TPR) repeat protein